MSRKLVNVAYDVLKEQRIKDPSIQQKSFNFDEIIQIIINNQSRLKTEDCNHEQCQSSIANQRLDSQTIKNYLGDIYTTLIQDTRFILEGELLWKLREFLPLEEITNINNKMYDIGLYKDKDNEDVDVDSNSAKSIDDEEDDNIIDEFNYDDEEAEKGFESKINTTDEEDESIDSDDEEEDEN